MKKNLIFTAVLSTLWAGCSQSSDYKDEFKNETDLVSIQLNTTLPTVSVTTKGNGYIDGWNGHTVYVYELPRNTNNYQDLQNEDKPIYNIPAIINAPTNGNETSRVDWADHTTRYFPYTGIYDFFAYHADDALTEEEGRVEKDRIYWNFEIDGTQDLMIAKAVPYYEEGAAELTDSQQEKIFSSYTARRKVQPLFNFKHLLSRLKFTIIPGGKEASEVFVKRITVTSPYKGNLVVAANSNYSPGIGLRDIEATTAEFVLKEYKNGILVDLNGEDHKPIPFDPTKDKTQQEEKTIGNDILIIPTELSNTSVTATFELAQRNEDGIIMDIPKFKKVLIPENNGNQTTFEAGKYYNIKLTIYSFEKIEIQATLEDWTEGGAIEIDPDQD